jgi:hypothetical protein
MIDRQQAKMSMYRRVADTCHHYEQAYAEVPAFVKAVMLLDNSIAAISMSAQRQQGTQSEGVTADKSRVGETLAEECVKIANSLSVYALDTGDSVLRAKVKLNKSRLYNGYDGNALVLAKIIAAEAHLHEAALVRYGIEPAAIATFDTLVAAFEQLVIKPQLIINERKLYTAQLKLLFAETDAIMHHRLDKLIIMFLTSAPDFYARYKNARNII